MVFLKKHWKMIVAVGLILTLGGVFSFWKHSYTNGQSASFKLLERLENYEKAGYYYAADGLLTIGGTHGVYISKDKQIWFNYDDGLDNIIEENSQITLIPEKITLQRVNNPRGVLVQDFWKYHLSLWQRFGLKETKMITLNDREWYFVALAGNNDDKDGTFLAYTDCDPDICVVRLRPSEMYPVDATLWEFMRVFKFFRAEESGRVLQVLEHQNKDVTYKEAKEQVRKFDEWVKHEEAKGWRYISGDPQLSCSEIVFEGEIKLKGWYVWDYIYIEKGWVFYTADEDVKKIPVYDTHASYDEIGKERARKFVLSNVPKEVENSLRQASKERPYEIVVDKYSLYCEGLPLANYAALVE